MRNRKAKTFKDKGEKRSFIGDTQILADVAKKNHDNDWNLGWFEPKGLQLDVIDSINKNIFTIVDGPSGSGKTSTALWYALSSLKNREYHTLVFAKNPTETGDDKIGYLSGNEQDKLQAHYETTKVIFQNFISEGKLTCDLGKSIKLKIPNFLLGATFDNSIIILDECQLMSPETIKLLLERCGKHTKYIILGDSQQKYAVTKRQDGFKNFIDRSTIYVDQQKLRYPKYPTMVGYVKMSRHDNQRSDGSKFINKIYEEEE